MDASIETIMQKYVISVAMQDTVEAVEQTLATRGLSSVPVIDPERKDCFGILSAPDLVRFHAAKQNPKVMRAWEVCTPRPIEVDPDISVREAAALMIKHRIHHLVVTRNKTIRGFVSSLDMIEHLLAKAREDGPVA